MRPASIPGMVGQPHPRFWLQLCEEAKYGQNSFVTNAFVRMEPQTRHRLRVSGVFGFVHEGGISLPISVGLHVFGKWEEITMVPTSHGRVVS